MKAMLHSLKRAWVRRWMTQIIDPIRLIKGIAGYAAFFADWRQYARLPTSEPIRLLDTYPQVHDRTSTTPFDSHYFYATGWAMRRIIDGSPTYHVDVGSLVTFVNLLGALIPVMFIDYRPLNTKLGGLYPVEGDILSLALAKSSIHSLSCLHVIEHIGLGRYGDLLDTEGSRKAARELTRILAPQGNLFVAMPVGRPRLCFNAHRIYAPETVRKMFSDLALVEFSGVHDDGRYVERVSLSEFKDSCYACGFFWFRRD